MWHLHSHVANVVRIPDRSWIVTSSEHIDVCHPAPLRGDESTTGSLALRGGRDAKKEPHQKHQTGVDLARQVGTDPRARVAEVHVLMPMRHADGEQRVEAVRR